MVAAPDAAAQAHPARVEQAGQADQEGGRTDQRERVGGGPEAGQARVAERVLEAGQQEPEPPGSGRECGRHEQHAGTDQAAERRRRGKCEHRDEGDEAVVARADRDPGEGEHEADHHPQLGYDETGPHEHRDGQGCDPRADQCG